MVTGGKVTRHLLGVRAYARHRGVSHVAVLKAIKEGRIRRTKSGKIDVEEADRAWRESTAERTSAAAHLPPKNEDGKKLTLTDARTTHESIKAKRAELEYERAIGRVVDADVVRDRWFKVLRTLRDRGFGLPDRMADALALEPDPAKIHRMLLQEIRTVFDGVADDLDALAAAEELEAGRSSEAAD